MPTLTIPWTSYPPDEFTRGAVTVGNFDGVHLGHRALLDFTIRRAHAVAGPAVVVTFDPPPIALLNPTSVKAPVTTPTERAELLLAAGVDHVVTLKADAGLLSLSPEAFFEDVILGLFRARAVVEGFNFHFGRARAGDNQLLARLCTQHGLSFEQVQPQLADGGPISSSRVRAALNAGDLVGAATLLGRNYHIRGIVETGAKRGRTIGFPTANLGGIATLLPKEGVYSVLAEVSGRRWKGAANIGPAPTFGVTARKVEVHLIDFSGDIYGQELRVEFMRMLREVRPFGSVAELVEQLKNDVAAARE